MQKASRVAAPDAFELAMTQYKQSDSLSAIKPTHPTDPQRQTSVNAAPTHLENLENPILRSFQGFQGTPQGVPPIFERPIRPLNTTLLTVPKLTPTMLPEALRGSLIDSAERMNTPLEFGAAAALVALAAVAGRKITIRPKKNDDWGVVPNLWGASVGTPGVQKSPATKEALAPLARLESEAFKKHKVDLEAFNADDLVRKAKSKAAATKLEYAAKKGALSDAELRSLAQEAMLADSDGEPPPHRYIVNDSTVEAIGERLRENPNGLLVFRDELKAFLLSLDKQGREGDRQFYLEAWNGNVDHTVDRIGRGTVRIQGICLSLFGTIQPSPLARYIRVTGDDADGFIQRFQILVYPDTPPYKRVDRSPNLKARNRALDAFRKIDSFDAAALCAEIEEGALPFLRFDAAAQEFFDEWLHDLETQKLRTGIENPSIESHLAKYRSLMPSLALLFHVVDVADGLPPGQVSLSCAQRAAAWCDFLEAHARRIYNLAFEADLEPARALGEKIKQGQPARECFKVNDVTVKGWSGLTTTDAVQNAISILEDHGWVKSVDTLPGPGGGRPSRTIWVHPNVRLKEAS